MESYRFHLQIKLHNRCIEGKGDDSCHHHRARENISSSLNLTLGFAFQRKRPEVFTALEASEGSCSWHCTSDSDWLVDVPPCRMGWLVGNDHALAHVRT